MACLLSPFPLGPGAEAKVNAAIVGFVVVTGTQWAKKLQLHTYNTQKVHILGHTHTHTSGCFEGAVVCHPFVSLT